MDKLSITAFGLLCYVASSLGTGDSIYYEYLSTNVTKMVKRRSITFCTIDTWADVGAFYLNISINTSAVISYTYGASMVNQSDNGNWFYMQNSKYITFMRTYVWFELSGSSETAGNCTWHLYVAKEKNKTVNCVNSTDTSTTTNTTSDHCGNLTDTTLSTSFVRTTPGNSDHQQTTDYNNIAVNCDDRNLTNNGTSLCFNVSVDVTQMLESNSTSEENSTCLCRCPCIPISQETADVKLKEIIEELRIHKNSTVLAKRKKECASDKRWLSRGIGFVGVLVLTLVFGVIFIGDTKLLLEDTRRMLNHVKRLLHCE